MVQAGCGQTNLRRLMTTQIPSDGDDGKGRSVAGFADTSYGDEIALMPLVVTVWSYRYVILGFASVVLLVAASWGGARYLFQPVDRNASVGLRLLFDGADKGEYPNGLQFSVADIVGTPVLTHVHETNELDRYIDFDSFAGKIVILGRNPALQALEARYQAILERGGLDSVATANLDTEFRLSREAVEYTVDYTLNFVEAGNVFSIPPVLLEKVLNDILGVWSVQMVTRRGVSRYERTVLGGEDDRFNEGWVEGNYIAQVDILRGRISRLIYSLDQLDRLRGGSVTRTATGGVSLSEILATLEDVSRYRLSPLVGTIWRSAIPSQTVMYASYIEDRQLQASLDLKEAEGRVSAIESAMLLYSSYNADEQAPSIGDPGSESVGSQVSQATSPQFRESFLDRIMEMGRQSSDVEYRQLITDQLISYKQDAVTYERELNHYDQMVAMQRSVPAQAGTLVNRPLESVASPMAGQIEERLGAIDTLVTEAYNQASDIYEILTNSNLNPQGTFFTITNPFTITETRLVSFRTLMPFGLLVLVLSFLIVPLCCLVYDFVVKSIRPVVS